MSSAIRITTKLSHIERYLPLIKESPKMIKFIKEIDQDVILCDEIDITDVDFFCRPGDEKNENLGFVKCKGMYLGGPAKDKINGPNLAGNIAFIRGGSVAVLIIVNIGYQKHILLCEQIRFPVGKKIVEICAGMIDDSTHNVIGTVFKEIKEETGLEVNQAELIPLGSIYPSPGGCDEEISLFACEKYITQKEFDIMTTKVYGNVHENELIKLKFEPFETFEDSLLEIKDVKAECCWYRYLNHLKFSAQNMCGALYQK